MLSGHCLLDVEVVVQQHHGLVGSGRLRLPRRRGGGGELLWMEWMSGGIEGMKWEWLSGCHEGGVGVGSCCGTDGVDKLSGWMKEMNRVDEWDGWNGVNGCIELMNWRSCRV